MTERILQLDGNTRLLKSTADIVSAYVESNAVDCAGLNATIEGVFRLLASLGNTQPATRAQSPAVPVKRSITQDYLVCLEDGKKLKMLKRYLRTAHGLTPEAYRLKWNLPADYPMVAPGYRARRSEFAKTAARGRAKSPRPLRTATAPRR